ncbi:hypothetical protein BH23GEM9_BH23GEM9_02990 [soil metagenome]
MLAQVDARALEALERIATAQIVMAVVMSLIGLLVLGVSLAVLLEVRSIRRQLARSFRDMRPQFSPLLDRLKFIANDVSGVSDNVRRKVDDVLHTVEEVHRSVKRGTAATEERLRRFTAVLDVVQEETEELLLDAAATAHGVHETARVLREPRGQRRARQTLAPVDDLPNEEKSNE